MQINGPKIYFTIPILGGIPVTQTLLTSFIATLILCVTGYLLGRKLKKRPGRMQVMTEKGVTVMTNMVKEAMGEHNALHRGGLSLLPAGDPPGYDRHPPLLHRGYQHHHDLGGPGELHLLVSGHQE